MKKRLKEMRRWVLDGIMQWQLGKIMKSGEVEPLSILKDLLERVSKGLRFIPTERHN